MACIRCGSDSNIEKHHIVQRRDNGSDDEENLQELCRPCHKYEHTKLICEDTLLRERMRGESARTVFLANRLTVIESLNTPELIRERGSYQSYWIDPATRKIPRWIPNYEERKVERIIQLALEGANP